MVLITLNTKLEIQPYEYKWLKSEWSLIMESQIQYSQYHLTIQINPNYSKVFNRFLNDKKKNKNI